MGPARWWSLASVLALALPTAGDAQQRAGVPSTVGLVLSGGGAKGIAHVCVLRTLERLGVRIDVVAGTSMGAVVGGLYSIGLSVDSIETIMTSADWPALIGDGIPRRRRFVDQRRLDERIVLSVPIEQRRVALPAGAIVGSNVMRTLEHVTWRAATVRRFADFPRPFVAVATDLETGEAVPLREGVLSEAMRASSGVPGALEPMALEGRLLVDGALSRNLPAVDAHELGADFLICSDVSSPIDSAENLQTVVDVLSQLASLAMLPSNLAQRALCDILIRPDVDDLSGIDFTQAGEWVQRGEAAASVRSAELRAVAERDSRVPPFRAVAPMLGDSVRIDAVRVATGVDPRVADLVLRELALAPGDYASRERMEARLGELDATGLFGLTRYRLDASGTGTAVTVVVRERPRDRLGVGLRYDDERRASLLFTATVHNVLQYGSVTRLDLRVGQETRLGASYTRRRGVTGRLGIGAGVHWSQAPLDLPPAEGGRVGVEITSASMSLGLTAGRATYLGVEVAGELTASRADAAEVALASASAVLDHETLDRIDFPRSGAEGAGRLEWGISDLTEGGWFSSTVIEGRAYLSLHGRVTLDVGGFAGYARGADLPAHRRFFLGGSHRSAVFRATHPLFQGIESQEQSGRAVQVARAGLRWEMVQEVYVRAGVDVGRVGDEWTLPMEEPMTGWALSLGAPTLIGPVVLELSQLWADRDPRLSISVGRWF
jgi:NTE family protein